MLKLKASKSRYSQIRQSRFEEKKSVRRYQVTNKGNNPSGRYNNFKYRCMKCQCPQAHKTNISELRGKYMSRHNVSGRSQHPTLINRQNISDKSNKDIIELNNTADEMNLTDNYGAFHPMTAGYTFFLETHGTFSKIDHHSKS
jgi:hypothetical protein